MTTETELLEFFKSYGRVFDDGAKLSQFYGECALASAPNFVGCLKGKEEVTAALTGVAEYQKKTGMTSVIPLEIETSEIDPLHIWVKVQWSAKFKKTAEKQIVFDISYLLKRMESGFVILTYVADQDEQQLREKYGLA